MPTLSNAAHFLNLIVDAPVVFTWVGFQELTGLTVVPFSAGCTAGHINFPEDQYSAGVAFFNAYKTYDTVDARAKFLQSRTVDEHHEGRRAVKVWITGCWKEWEVSDAVAKGLKQAGFEGFEYHLESGDDKWQDSKDAQIHYAHSQVAHVLFGIDGIDPSRKRIKPAVLSFVTGLGVASWKAQGRAWVRARNRLGDLHGSLVTDYTALENADNMTATEISRLIKRIKNVVVKAGKFGDLEMTKVVELWEERLTTLRAAADKDKAANAKIPAALRNALAALADTPTIRFVIDEIAHTLVEMSAQPAQEQLPEVMVSFDDWASGVEDLQNKTPAELWDMLGLPGKALPGFNTVEDPNGVVDPWSEEWKGFVASRKGVPFGPRWHQLVGMVKLMRHVIRGRPLLLMDEVGVGKTMQIVGMLSLYPVYRQFWLKEGHFPGAFANLLCAKGGGNLPDLPHIIIVPPPLFKQWQDEFRRYVQHGWLDLIPYQGQWDVNLRTLVWNEINTLKPGQMKCQKVILVSAPAAERDLDYAYHLPLPIPPASPLEDASADISLTLFGHDVATVNIDEAAKCRNLNRQWAAVHAVVENAVCGIAMTATPIHNGPADLFHLGMALNVPDCDDLDWLSDMKKAVSRATRKSNAEFRRLRASDDFVQSLMDGSLDLAFKREQLEEMGTYVRFLREIFSGYIIRRTIDSIDYRGDPISGLRKYFEKRLLLAVREEEKTALENTASDIMKEHETSRAAAMVAQAEGHAFYGQFRRTHTHYLLREQPTWVPSSREEWESKKSSKLDALVQILLYHLEQDNRAPLVRDDRYPDQNVFIPDPNFRPRPRDAKSPNDRVVVYSAFPSNNLLLTTVLAFFHILCYEVNGLKSGNVRQDTMDKFRRSTRDDPRVLLLSNVGMAGINLPEANILIALDQLWSHQDLTQLIGRVWRLPQEKDVFVYIPVLNDTTDMFLSVLSFTKSQLLSAFTQATKDQKQLFQHLLPPSLRDMREHDDDEEINGAIEEEDVDDKAPVPKPVNKPRAAQEKKNKKETTAKRTTKAKKDAPAAAAKTAEKKAATSRTRAAVAASKKRRVADATGTQDPKAPASGATSSMSTLPPTVAPEIAPAQPAKPSGSNVGMGQAEDASAPPGASVPPSNRRASDVDMADPEKLPPAMTTDYSAPEHAALPPQLDPAPPSALDVEMANMEDVTLPRPDSVLPMSAHSESGPPHEPVSTSAHELPGSAPPPAMETQEEAPAPQLTWPTTARPGRTPLSESASLSEQPPASQSDNQVQNQPSRPVSQQFGPQEMLDDTHARIALMRAEKQGMELTDDQRVQLETFRRHSKAHHDDENLDTNAGQPPESVAPLRRSSRVRVTSPAASALPLDAPPAKGRGRGRGRGNTSTSRRTTESPAPRAASSSSGAGRSRGGRSKRGGRGKYKSREVVLDSDDDVASNASPGADPDPDADADADEDAVQIPQVPRSPTASSSLSDLPEDIDLPPIQEHVSTPPPTQQRAPSPPTSPPHAKRPRVSSFLDDLQAHGPRSAEDVGRKRS